MGNRVFFAVFGGKGIDFYGFGTPTGRIELRIGRAAHGCLKGLPTLEYPRGAVGAKSL
jgi:hypothetical protein